MNVGTVKDYLNQIHLYDKKIDAKLDEMTRLREMATKITSTMQQDVVNGGASQDKLGDSVAKIIDLQVEINADVDHFADAKRETSKLLEMIENKNQYEVLHKRYVQYKSWEQIACEMHMTYRNVCYIHGNALQKLGELMKGGENG